jgi:hypothetical protein
MLKLCYGSALKISLQKSELCVQKITIHNDLHINETTRSENPNLMKKIKIKPAIKNFTGA